MNNEEKILAMLAEMKEDLAAVKATQAKQGEQLATQGEQLAEVKAAQTAQSEQLAEVTATQAIQQSQLDKLVEMQDELRTAVNRVAMAQEQDMLPYIKLLDEGHHDIMRQLVTKERVEVLEKEGLKWHGWQMQRLFECPNILMNSVSRFLRFPERQEFQTEPCDETFPGEIEVCA